ncbi:MAG TPA: SDR family NAD(P)-dependent oxidoreductase [Kofleriaceae bacterium]|nr:SDR family NAD(P)-dependent oxidoreductase [Kofleriaceae bacterium]
MKARYLIGAAAALAARALWREAHAYDLHDKVVLVTGGSRGLGLVLARQLLACGARVAICARDAAELQRAHDDLAPRGTVLALSCDITRPGQVVDLIETVRARLGPIDVLVNNAGVIEVGPMELMTIGDHDEAMRTHFWAPLELILAVLPDMRERKAGRIVNIASIGGKLPAPHLLPYTASKFALVGLSSGLRVELAKEGIRVTTVIPGLMRTGSTRQALFKGRHRDEHAWFAIAGSNPLTAISAERAAHRIVSALRHGDAEVVLGLQAALAARLYGLAPSLGQDLLGLVARVLPGPGGIGAARVRGMESTSRAAPSLFTRAGDRAAARNNEN